VNGEAAPEPTAPERTLGGPPVQAEPEPVAVPSPAADALEDIPIDSPLVGIVMGSRSDLEIMQAAARELDDRGISHETRVISAHREPDTVAEYARTARLRGLRVVIAGAGLSAALPGAIAAHTDLPVIGVPLTSRLTAAGGLDAILSITQMPPGVPVACVGLDNPRNAAVLAARILGAGGPATAPGGRPSAVG
jgi:5-(carboxyamino)imidazole ribonucleotide mutase